jgi:hypothetical protein
MKKVYLLLASLIVLSACKKDHSSAGTSGPSTNPASYALISYASFVNQTLVDSMSFTYDAAARLLTSYVDIPFGSGQIFPTEYQFSYTNGKCTRIDITAEGYSTYYTYQYNSDSTVDTVKFYSSPDTVPAASAFFSYNATGQMVDEFDFAGSLNYSHYVYTYDALGDLSTSVDSSLASSPGFVTTWRYTDYDSKVNLLRAVPGYPTTNSLMPSFGGQHSSPHNCLQTITTGNIAPGGQYVADTVNFKYTYNSAGLPTQIVNGIDTFRLVYMQF